MRDQRKPKSRARLSSLLILALLIAIPAIAQSDRGTITGTVSDPVGAAVPMASVTATNALTGAVYETRTTETGNYTLPSLPVGIYDLTAEAPGFGKFTQKGIGIQIVQTVRIDVKLQVGSTSESVTVTADAPLLKTEDGAQSQVMSGDSINELPTVFASSSNGTRNPLSLILLNSAVTPLGTGTEMRMNGTPKDLYKVLVDGQDITTSAMDPSHFSEAHPSMEGLVEVSLQSSNFSAEFGQVAGGLFNLVARSGANQFHGSAYDYLKNEALNAGQPFTNDGNGHLVRPRSRSNNWGVSVGGPVWIPKVYDGRNRTFFFFNLEQFRYTQRAGGSYTTVPTALMRNGDFSQALTGRVLGTTPDGASILEGEIFDPLSNYTYNGQTLRKQFPGNAVPQSRMDPIALKLQSMIPTPALGTLTQNLPINDLLTNNTSIPSVKIDQYFGPKLKVGFYWGTWVNLNPKSGADGLPVLISPARIFETHSPTARLTIDYTITPTSLLHVGFGVLRYVHVDSEPPEQQAVDSKSLLGLTGAVPGTTGMPYFSGLGSASGLGFPNTISWGSISTYYSTKPTAIVNWTWIKGNHSFKTGMERRSDSWTAPNFGPNHGNYNFGAAETALPYLQTTSVSGAQVGMPYASFLLGAVTSASVGNTTNPYYVKYGYGMYVQDNWKVTRNLTLDYGLRWDLQSAWDERLQNVSMFGPTISNPSAGGRLGGMVYEGYGTGRCNCSFVDTYPYAIGPRIGVAWHLAPKTVLRGGWGFIYGNTYNGNYIGASDGMAWNTINFSSASFGQPALYLKDGLQYDVASLYKASLDPGLRPQKGQINSPKYYYDRNGGRPPRINQWNISLQREITSKILVEASYIGNRSVWLPGDGLNDFNAVTPQMLAARGLDINNAADRTLLTSTWTSALAVSRGFGNAPYPGYPTGLTVAQTLRPYPQFGFVPSVWAPLGASWYDALQVRANTRATHGLTAGGSFTWQKEINLASSDGNAYGSSYGAAINDAFNRGLNRYISNYSQPFVFSMYFTYQTPAAGANSIVRSLTRGWTISGVFRDASGFPITVPNATNNLNQLLFRGTGTTYSNRVPGVPLFLKDLNCHCIDPNKEFVLNPAAWSQPAPGQFGTSPAYWNDYRYARRPMTQATFGRVFRIRESMSLQLRVELFNVFNMTYLNNPSNSNAQATQVISNGKPISGFGYISSNSTYSPPRTGLLTMRFQF
jgi:hypothetical protein